MSKKLLELDDVTLQYETDAGDLTAVSNASFSVDRKEFYGLAGESGSGKSTLAKAIIGGLDENGKISSGKIKYKGTEIQDYTEEEFNKNLRWKEIAWIPQGAMNSLDPLMRISEQATRIAQRHTDLSKDEALDKFKEMFDVVGLAPSRVTDYPHQFSGGMAQRAIIAMALFLEPDLVIADEPTTALDVIMQDQVFKYLDEVKEEINTSILLITHDISVIFESCDSVAIMHSSQVAENGDIGEVYDSPRHPYAIMFQEAFPDIREPERDLEVIDGYPPQLFGEVDKCSFVDRCPWAVEECYNSAPKQEAVSDEENHYAACFRKDEIHELYEQERRKSRNQKTTQSR